MDSLLHRFDSLGAEPLAWAVTQQAATEPPFSGRYDHFFGAGRYVCVCCGVPLFAAQSKFDSGCGWPAFSAPVQAAAVQEQRDASHGMQRTEILCSGCGAHLGHVFPDGPQPTGLRYCINSAALLHEDVLHEEVLHAGGGEDARV